MPDNQNKLSPEEAERKIREIVEYGYIERREHFYERMEQGECDYNDLLLILSKGKVKEPPKYDKKFKNWRYKVEGRTVEGDNVVIVVAIESNTKLVCITIIPQ